MDCIDVFTSYSGNNRDLVEPLAKTLEDMSYSVFYDTMLHAYDKWWDSILDNIRNAHIFIYELIQTF